MLVRWMQKDLMVWGPLFLLLSIFLVPHLLAIGLIGLYLSFRLRFRGSCYAWVLLTLFALVNHLWLTDRHLFQLGVEGSLAIAFLISGLSMEEIQNDLLTKEVQIARGKETEKHLEEERCKSEELFQQKQILSQEKIGTLQKELEELQTEHSSILILNEVLRKTSAKQLEEKDAAVKENGTLKEELLTLREEIGQLASIELQASENRKLKQEKEELFSLNAMLRDELITLREETSQIAHKENRKLKQENEDLLSLNETLNRLYVKEQFKAKEASEEAQEMALQIGALRREKGEHLLKQLKKQFEEKNQVLHQTRIALFKSDTELEKLKIENESLKFSPLPKEMEQEMFHLSQQVEKLEEENERLEELVTHLTDTTGKKKVKMKSLSEQGLLFS